MRYPDGEEARIGDRVRIGEKEHGIVVCSPDTEEYSDDYPRIEWQSLGKGVLVKFEQIGLVHYIDPEPGLVLLERGRKRG